MNKHTLRLLGGPVEGLRVPASVLHEAVGALLDAARMATRLAVEGESVRKGPRPAWLDAACDFEVTGLSAGSAIIALEAPSLREVDPVRFGVGAQRSLFGESNERFGEQTAIDILGDLLATIQDGDRDDIVADRALLESCSRLARVSGSSYRGVALEGLQGRRPSLTLHAQDAVHMERLRDETPRPQAARVAGTLDTVSASRSDVVLALKDGSRVPGRLEAHDLEALRSLLGRDVVVSGMAHYRPSGRLLLLDVESLDLAREEDRIFECAPVARRVRLTPESAGSDEQAGVSTFFGTWPGDETDNELLDALRALG